MEYVWYLEKSLSQNQAHVDSSISLGNGMTYYVGYCEQALSLCFN
jgi:hypothetical protein